MTGLLSGEDFERGTDNHCERAIQVLMGEYPRRLDAESALWYRKGKGGGVWFARWRNRGPGANYKQAAIGPANDLNDKIVDVSIISYKQNNAKTKL